VGLRLALSAATVALATPAGYVAAGNLALALAVGPELRRLLERNARRLRTEVIWA